LKLQLQNFEKIKKSIPKSQEDRELLFKALADVLGPSRVNALLGRSTAQSETKKSTSRASYEDNSDAVIDYLKDKRIPESKSEIEIGIGIVFTAAHWVKVRKDISAKGWRLENHGQSRNTTYSILRSGKKKTAKKPHSAEEMVMEAVSNKVNELIDQKGQTFGNCFKVMNTYRAKARAARKVFEEERADINSLLSMKLESMIDGYLSKLTKTKRDLTKSMGRRSPNTKIRDVIQSVEAFTKSE